MNFTYLIILAAVLVTSPFILRMAASQKKEVKQQLKLIYILMLSLQILFGFLNWVPMIGWISGFKLATAYPTSLLWVFFAISFIQIVLVMINTQKLNIFSVVLNFINSVLIFVSLSLTSRIIGIQIFSIPPIVIVFLVLFGNIIGLSLINQDKNLLKKYFRR